MMKLDDQDNGAAELGSYNRASWSSILTRDGKNGVTKKTFPSPEPPRLFLLITPSANEESPLFVRPRDT